MDFGNLDKNPRGLTYLMLTDGPGRIQSLIYAVERAEGGQEIIDSLVRDSETLEQLKAKHVVFNPFLPEMNFYETVGLDGFSEAALDVIRTCVAIHERVSKLEKETSSRLADRYRREGIPSPDANTWIENQALGWVEAHQPGLARERLERDRKMSGK
jgi:hypothetical protein